MVPRSRRRVRTPDRRARARRAGAQTRRASRERARSGRPSGPRSRPCSRASTRSCRRSRPGPAPLRSEGTGDFMLCAPWSFAGVPSIAIPTGLDAAGLPLALQLVGASRALERLLGAAAWCERGRRLRRAAPCDRPRDDALWSRSAAWLARAIAAREVSSLEVVDACLARIEAVNPRINAVVRLAADARDRARAADAALARGEATGPLHGVPFTIKDSMDTAGVVTTAGTIGWRERDPRRATRRSSRASAPPAGSSSARPTPPSSPGPTRPTTTSTAGRRTRTTSTARPAAAAAGRPRSSPRAARRSTSAATAATRSASPRTCAASRGSSRRAVACRGPGTGRGRAACSSRSPSSGRSPAGSRTSRSSCRSSPAPTARTRTSSPVAAGRPGAGRRRRASRVAWFGDNGIRTPTPETLEAVARAVAAIAATGAHRRGAPAARHRRRAAGVGGGDPRRRVRLAVAPDRGRRDARSRLVRHGSAGSPSAPASRWPATR